MTVGNTLDLWKTRIMHADYFFSELSKWHTIFLSVNIAFLDIFLNSGLLGFLYSNNKV